MLKNVTVNGRVIEYELLRKNVKKINIRIKPDGSVHVSASRRVTLEVIEKVVVENGDFILNAIEKRKKAKESLPQELKYVSGEKILVFGSEIPLEVVYAKKNSAKLCDGRLVVAVTDTENYAFKQKIISKFLENLCKETVMAFCREIYPAFEKCGVAFPEIKFRTMVSRWGSCNYRKNLLTFNYHLVKVPFSAVKYVVVHEFTHFLVHNHSKDFYLAMEGFMPDAMGNKKLLHSYDKYLRR